MGTGLSLKIYHTFKFHNPIKSMHVNFDPTDIDLSRPGEAFVKSSSYLMLGTMFEGINLQTMHIPPIFLEFAKLLAYLGASVAFFKFLFKLLSKPKDTVE